MLNGAMSVTILEGYQYNNSMGEFITLALGQKGRLSLLEVLTHRSRPSGVGIWIGLERETWSLKLQLNLRS